MKESWSSKNAFILAAIGSAVGLGNIWRFPYITGENGGAAFLIPYIASIILIGIPLMLLEMAAGEKFKGSIFKTLRHLNPKLAFLGFLPLIVTFGVLSYYAVIAGWTLIFFISFLFGNPLIFPQVESSLLPIIAFATTLAIVGTIVARGIKQGLEMANKIMLPLLFIFLIALAIFSLTTSGTSKALEFYLAPNFDKIWNVQTWTIAIAHVLFSLSVGYGMMLTFGSYLKKQRELISPSIAIASADMIIALIGGLVVFPLVFTFGFLPTEGVPLAFEVLPKIFSQIPFGFFLAALFFLALFFAALTSAISMLEVIVSASIEELNWSRQKSTILATTALFLAGLPSALSYSSIGFFGVKVLDIMDDVFASNLAIISGIALCAIIAHSKRFDSTIYLIGLPKKFYSLFSILTKYCIPIILALIFIASKIT